MTTRGTTTCHAEQARIAYLMRAIAAKKAEISYANATLVDASVRAAEHAAAAERKREQPPGGASIGGKLFLVWLLMLLPLISCYVLNVAWRGFEVEKILPMSDLTSNTSRRGEASGAFLGGEAEDGRGLISEAGSDDNGYGTGTGAQCARVPAY